MYPIPSQLTGRAKKQFFKLGSQWIANIFKTNLLPYVQHSILHSPKTTEQTGSPLQNYFQHNSYFLLNFISVIGYFLKCCEV